MRKQYSGSMSPDTFNLWAPVAQTLHLLVKCGLPEEYKITTGYPASGQRRALMIVREAPQELEGSMTLSDEMQPFLQTTLVSGSSNLFSLPPDFVRYRPSNYKYIYQVTENGQVTTTWRWKPLEFVTGAERNYRLDQYINKPSLDYPVISYQNGQFLVDLDLQGLVTIPQINLSYVRLPKDPVRNYTLNANDQDIYNPAGSVNFEFQKTEWEAICRRLIRYWAESIRDDDITKENFVAIQGGQ